MIKLTIIRELNFFKIVFLLFPLFFNFNFLILCCLRFALYKKLFLCFIIIIIIIIILLIIILFMASSVCSSPVLSSSSASSSSEASSSDSGLIIYLFCFTSFSFASSFNVLSQKF